MVKPILTAIFDVTRRENPWFTRHQDAQREALSLVAVASVSFARNELEDAKDPEKTMGFWMDVSGFAMFNEDIMGIS